MQMPKMAKTLTMWWNLARTREASQMASTRPAGKQADVVGEERDPVGVDHCGIFYLSKLQKDTRRTVLVSCTTVCTCTIDD